MLFSLFFIGLFFGSFFLVIIDRFTAKKNFWSGRSECASCHHLLVWYDLVPVISFILLSGKCRYCHKKLSLSYPLFELSTGLLFALTFVLLPQQNTMSVLYYFCIVSVLWLTF